MILTQSVQGQQTGKVLFTSQWKFKLDSVGTYEKADVPDAEWRTLDLPHDWSIEGRFSKDNPATPGGGALPGGVGWYRKTFLVPATDKNKITSIEFDGVYCNSEVWINGHYLGIRPNGYISFRYDLTPYLKYGIEKNVIAVKVDNSRQPNSRWYSGSGIYRNVWLITSNPLHVGHWGTYVTTPEINENRALVKIQTQIKDERTKPGVYTLTNNVYNAEGTLVASKSVPSSGGTNGFFTQELELTHPRLWSTEDPYLYKVVSVLSLNGQTVDTYETPLGIRFFNFDIDKGFSLNGKRMKILGVCNHHDLGALGAAINIRALERQLDILKEMGCNAIRTSHNPPAPELLDLADKKGFIIMDEAFDMWAKSKNPFDYHLNWKEWHRRDLEDQILRDRNHPSVMIWSVGNEIPEQWSNDNDTSGRTIARELVAIVRSLDTTREIVTANNDVNTHNNILQSGAFDLVGYNYNHNLWGSFRERWPGKKFIVTESTSALETRGHYDLVPFDTIRRWPERWDKPFTNGNPDLTVSAYDHVSTPWGSTHEESWKVLKKYDHISGMFIWTGFDYLGEPTPYPWPARSSYFGIIDLAGFPKDVYYMYQSEWTTQPVLHLYPHWNWKKGDTVDVISYYNNADEVELFLNGKSLGRRTKKGEDLHVAWRVPFTPGTLKAVSKKEGKIILSKEVKTAGAPARILLQPDH
jgi:beta-galactosidase